MRSNVKYLLDIDYQGRCEGHSNNVFKQSSGKATFL